MVVFFQKVLVLMHFSYSQTHKPSILLNLEIWILVTEICFKIEVVWKFDSLEAYKGKKFYAWLARAALKNTKIQIV